MKRCGEVSTREERLIIAGFAQAGWTDRQTAAHMGCSRWTVRKWRRAFQRQGSPGLTSRMGRPVSGVLGSRPEGLRDAILAMHRAHPGWGPDTILTELRLDGQWASVSLPSRSRVAALLHAQGLTRPYLRHAVLPQAPPQAPQAPHDEWQLDAQGAQIVAGLGRVNIINIADVVSRLKVESYPHLWGQPPNRDDYQFVLRRSFAWYGLPVRISVDHDSVFFENITPSPFPSHLHLWLIALGIDVLFTRRRCPTDHAIIERGHQTMTAQAVAGQEWADASALWVGLDQRRAVLNFHFPSQALGGKSPLMAFPDALHSGRPYQPAWEEEMLDLSRVHAYLAKGCWHRATSCHGEFWLGLQRYNAGRRYAKRSLTLTFDPGPCEFVCQPDGTEATLRFAAKGLSKYDLMGELTPLLAMPTYQPPLPFTRTEWRQAELWRSMRGTTL